MNEWTKKPDRGETRTSTVYALEVERTQDTDVTELRKCSSLLQGQEIAVWGGGNGPGAADPGFPQESRAGDCGGPEQQRGGWRSLLLRMPALLQPPADTLRVIYSTLNVERGLLSSLTGFSGLSQVHEALGPHEMGLLQLTAGSLPSHPPAARPLPPPCPGACVASAPRGFQSPEGKTHWTMGWCCHYCLSLGLTVASHGEAGSPVQTGQREGPGPVPG